MEIIEHTVAWCRGEIFEGRMLVLFGAVTVGVALGVFLWRPTPLGRALGLATLVLGFAVLFLDHFSEERADGYQTPIVEALEHPAKWGHSPPT